MLKKLGVLVFSLSTLLLLALNILSSVNISINKTISLVLSLGFWLLLILGIVITITLSLKHGREESGYFKKTKLTDGILLASAIVFFIGNFLKIDLIVAIAFPLIIYFFLLHLLLNTK